MIGARDSFNRLDSEIVVCCSCVGLVGEDMASKVAANLLFCSGHVMTFVDGLNVLIDRLGSTPGVSATFTASVELLTMRP